MLAFSSANAFDKREVYVNLKIHRRHFCVGGAVDVFVQTNETNLNQPRKMFLSFSIKILLAILAYPSGDGNDGIDCYKDTCVNSTYRYILEYADLWLHSVYIHTYERARLYRS